jgi:hypothetical protein
MTEQTEPIEEFVESEAESTDVTPEVEDDGQEYVEVSNAEEYWDAFDLSEYVTDSSEEESEESDDAEATEDVTEEAAFPSEDEIADAEDAEPVNLEEQPEADFSEEELLNLDLDRPAPLSRRKAEKVVKGIIEPLRDPNTPISDVLTALAEFHPTRTQQLAESIVTESVQAFPDDWLKSITGLDITVDQVKEWAASGGRQPSNPAPAASEPSQINEAVADLTDSYGDAWKDPANDYQMLPTDVTLAQAVRAQLQQNEEFTALQKELESTKLKLNELQPQIDSIKTAQEAEFEQIVQTTFAQEVDQYRQKVEGNSIPKVLEAKGLSPKDADSEEVKAVKQLLASRFQPVEGYGSDFDIFLEKQFSGKESMGKAMTRVANYLSEAAKIEGEARRATNPALAQTLKVKANGLKEQALSEQDALTVWTRKAATEFLDTMHVKPLIQLLEQNADLQRRLRSTGRPEIVGQTAAIGGEGGFRSSIQQAKEQGVNPFDVDISSILGGR